MFWLIIIVFVLFLYLILRMFKLPKFDNVICVTGEIGCGKSFSSVYLAVRTYRRRLFLYKVSTLLCKIFKRPYPEEPLLYSNMPLYGVKYVAVTRDLLLRKHRFAYKSVLLLDEVSLVQDSMTFRDPFTNETCSLFYKLFRHETRGGVLIFNTQAMADNHFSVKRSVSRFLFLHHRIKLPFFSVIFCRELIYSDDGASVNTFVDDVERSLLRFIVPNRFFRYFDTYWLSGLTDDLPLLGSPIYRLLRDRGSYKPSFFVSFRKFLSFTNKE